MATRMVANIRCNHQEENYVECHPNEKPLSNPFGDTMAYHMYLALEKNTGVEPISTTNGVVNRYVTGVEPVFTPHSALPLS